MNQNNQSQFNNPQSPYQASGSLPPPMQSAPPIQPQPKRIPLQSQPVIPQKPAITPASPAPSAPSIPSTTSTTPISPIAPARQASQPGVAGGSNYQQGMSSVLDLVAPAALEIKPNYLKLGNMFIRTLFVFTYPSYVNTNWLSPIINYDITLDISMFIYPIGSKEMMGQLRKKAGQLQSSLAIEQEKGLVRNPELETAIQNIEGLRDALQKGEMRLFQFGLYFTVYAKTEDELNTITDQLESTLGGMLICYIIYQLLASSLYLVILFDLPIALMAVAMAFLKIQDQPLSHFLAAGIQYFNRPKVRFWKRHGQNIEVISQAPAPVKKESTMISKKKIERSDLEKLANMLDTRPMPKNEQQNFGRIAQNFEKIIQNSSGTPEYNQMFNKQAKG